jgi:hypothetical protein
MTCQPVPDVIKIVKPVYTCKCGDLCYPKRSLHDLLRRRCQSGCCESGGGCGGCDCHCECPPCTCPQCECHPRHKMVLLKKLVTTECPAFKCEPVCCPQGCGGCAGPFESAPMPGEDHVGPDEAPPPKAIPVPPSAALRRKVR